MGLSVLAKKAVRVRWREMRKSECGDDCEGGGSPPCFGSVAAQWGAAASTGAINDGAFAWCSGTGTAAGGAWCGICEAAATAELRVAAAATRAAVALAVEVREARFHHA